LSGTAVRISVGKSRRLQRLRSGLSLTLAAASGIGLLQCDYRYFFLLLAALVLRRSLGKLDPSGITLAFSPAAGWLFRVDGVQRTQAGDSQLRMPEAGVYEPDGFVRCALKVSGRTPGLIWLEARPYAADMASACVAGLPGPARRRGPRDGLQALCSLLFSRLSARLSARRARRNWLIFDDALPDADWRCLRRTLRLQAYRGEGVAAPG
jgi:hypothetical protein